MAYEYDVFFSYKRDPMTDEWHRRLKKILLHHVQNEGALTQAKFFFDVEEIRSGAQFKNKIQKALARSKCLVCIWSPGYFESKYCTAEWKTFELRNLHCGAELVVSASRADGDSFPIDAQNRQYKRFNDFALTSAQFWETKRAVDFEADCLRPFAVEIAQTIRSAPDFRDDFPVVPIDTPEIPSGSAPLPRIASMGAA